jgi:hypothetical protein|tara:strand:+ start:494 stop:877 length:384 start_codon:yes stop_codon:yes gene_type:complete
MLDEIFKLISKVIPDTAKAKELEAQIKISYDNALSEGVKANKEIVLAEIQSDSWLQRSWRPIAALIVFGAIFVRFPLYHLLRLIVSMYELNIYLPELEELSSDFYLMATAFISIYAHGRSVEKRLRK